MIEYIKDRKRLGYLENGDKAYYRGKFLRCSVINNPNDVSCACPCDSRSCVFVDEKEKEEGVMCPVARYCMARFRKDQESVVFSAFTPTRIELERFLNQCESKGIKIEL